MARTAIDKLHPYVLTRLMFPRLREIALVALERGLIDLEELQKEYERWERSNSCEVLDTETTHG